MYERTEITSHQRNTRHPTKHINHQRRILHLKRNTIHRSEQIRHLKRPIHRQSVITIRHGIIPRQGIIHRRRIHRPVIQHVVLIIQAVEGDKVL
jgi:hypothetical protein